MRASNIMGCLAVIFLAIGGSSASDEAFAHKSDDLPLGVRARIGAGRFAHPAPVTSFSFSSDGKLLLSTCEDGIVRIWETATGQEFRRFDPRLEGKPETRVIASTVASAQFVDDGDSIAIAVLNRGVMIYEIRGAKLLHQVAMPSLRGNGSGIRLSPDGKQLVAWSQENQEKDFRLIDVNGDKELRVFKGHEGLPFCAAFSADGKKLVTGSDDQSIRIWDVATGKQLKMLEGHHSGVTSVAVSSDGKYIASASLDASLCIWDADGALVHRFTGLRPLAYGASTAVLHFSADSKALTASMRGGVGQWDVGSGKTIRDCKDPPLSATYSSFAMSPDGKVVARGLSRGSSIELVDAETGKPTFPPDLTTVYALTVSPDGKLLATGGSDQVIRIWDAKTGKEIRSLEGASDPIYFLQFTRNGKELISGCFGNYDRVISVWDVESGKAGRPIRIGGRTLQEMTLSADGHTLACLYQDQGGMSLTFIDPDTREVLKREKPGSGGSMALAADGKTYVRRSDGSTMSLYADGKEPRVLLRNFAFGSATFSPDGRRVAIMANDGVTHVYDVQTAIESQLLREEPKVNETGLIRERRWKLAFAPDGRTLVASGSDGDIVWEMASARPRRILRTEGDDVSNSLCFAPDGKTLYTGTQKGHVYFWDMARLDNDDKIAAEKLTVKDAEALWDELEGNDALKAYRAMKVLAAAPKVSLPLLKDKLKPADESELMKIAELIADLDSDDFEKRNRAVKALEDSGEPAARLLRKALNDNPSAEAAKRIDEILKNPATNTFHGRGLQAYRALEVLELIEDDEARSLVAKLAGGAERAWLTQEATAVRNRLKSARRE